MADLPRLILLPDSTGYSINFANNIVAWAVPGGPSATRTDFVGGVDSVALQWTLDRLQYTYIKAFERSIISQGADPFECQLIVDDEDADWYTCKLIGGSFKLASQRGLSYVVQATLEVMPQDVDADYDQAIFDLFGATDSSDANMLMGMLNQLEHLTNIDLVTFVAPYDPFYFITEDYLNGLKLIGNSQQI